MHTQKPNLKLTLGQVGYDQKRTKIMKTFSINFWLRSDHGVHVCKKKQNDQSDKFTGLEHCPRLAGANLNKAYFMKYCIFFFILFFQICAMMESIRVESNTHAKRIAHSQLATLFRPRVIRSILDEFSESHICDHQKLMKSTP